MDRNPGFGSTSSRDRARVSVSGHSPDWSLIAVQLYVPRRVLPAGFVEPCIPRWAPSRLPGRQLVALSGLGPLPHQGFWRSWCNDMLRVRSVRAAAVSAMPRVTASIQSALTASVAPPRSVAGSPARCMMAPRNGAIRQDHAQQGPQPPEQEAQVVADGSERGVVSIASAVREVIASHAVPGLETSNHGLDCGASLDRSRTSAIRRT